MKLPPYGTLRLGKSGRVAIVDLCDWFRLCRYSWRVTKDGHAYRVRTLAGLHRRQQLTHDVLGLSRCQRVAFRNGNPLDCRRSNLRLALGHISLVRRSRRNPYRVSVRVDGTLYDVGGWPSMRLAEEARRAAAEEAACLRGRGRTRAQIRRALYLAVGREVRAGPRSADVCTVGAHELTRIARRYILPEHESLQDSSHESLTGSRR